MSTYFLNIRETVIADTFYFDEFNPLRLLRIINEE